MAKQVDSRKACGIYLLVTAVFIFLCVIRVRASLYLSDPIAVHPPDLRTNNQIRFRPMVVTGGKTTLFGWGELRRVPGSLTNTVVVALDQSGKMIDPAGHVVAAAQYSGKVADLIPAGDDFFAVYSRKSLQTSNTNEWVFTVVDSEGKAVAEPVSFAKNAGINASASNGKTLLTAWMDSGIPFPGITFALHNRDGSQSKTANIAVGAPQYAYPRILAASAAGNYLVLLSYNGVIASFIDGATGGFSVKNFTTNNVTIDALRSNGSEYLLIGHTINSTNSETKIYRLDSRGATLAETAFPLTAQAVPPTIIPNGNDWLVFEQQSYESFENYTVRSQQNSLVIEPGPFPTIQGVAIDRFHGDQFVVGSVNGRDVSYRLISVDHSSPEQIPSARVIQSHTAVATSPAGYLVAWQEAGITTNILAMRFRRDGTRVDPEPLQIARDTVNDVIRINYEQSHYKIAWLSYNFASSTLVRSALVDAEGPANVRTNKITPLPGWVSSSMLEITPYRDTSIVFQRQENYTLQDNEPGPFQNWRIEARMTFAGRGEELLKVLDYGNIIAGRASGVFGDLTETHDFGPGKFPNAIAMTNTFLVTWRNQAGALVSALLQDGSLLQTNVLLAPSQIGTNFSLAASTNKAVVSAMAPGADLRNTNTFVLVDGLTGANSTLERTILYGTNRIVSVAPLGKDFIVGSSLWNGSTTYAAIQILSETPPPGISKVQITGGEFRIAFTAADPDRTYIVQRTSDFVSWETVATFSGNSSYEFKSPPQEPQTFYRIVALPD